MFGFIVANPEKLSEQQNMRYRAMYCGLCRALGEAGRSDKITLTYDMVFLVLLLNSVYNGAEEETVGKCLLHPIKERPFIKTEFSGYAAAMNVALAYYNFLDNWNDDKSVSSYIKASIFKKEVQKTAVQYPRQCKAITDCLERLSEAEKKSVMNPDIPAGIFGELMGEIFRIKDDENGRKLYDFGCALGKFIYIMDACYDLRSDIKHSRYNPLLKYTFESSRRILELLMADCVEKYNALSVERDREIIENILFSGVWTQYETDPRRRRKE